MRIFFVLESIYFKIIKVESDKQKDDFNKK
jgi:hypothetical protein